MDVIQDPQTLQSAALQVRLGGRSIGLVPTMGFLHEGHLSLIRAARADNDVVIVSNFVNPTQFGPTEDLNRYPRDLERDNRLCVELGVDFIFAPAPGTMYPEGFQTYIEVGPLAETLCGASRPGHFRGVATVVLKLFNLCQPTRAYFGTKDFQQLQVIRRMVKDFDLPLQVVAMPIVREPDGLAMSSRNAYLSADERKAALVLRKALDRAEGLWRAGERSSEVIRQAVLQHLSTQPLARVDYAEVADPETLAISGGNPQALLVALAVYIGKTRLIDNTVLGDWRW